MGRSPCCSKEGLNRGAWTAHEDRVLTEYIKAQGEGRWRNLPKRAGLKRCGKSCRLRWLNYLRPDIKRGNISPDEEELIIRLHKLLGNRWSLIAGRLPGRTDNEIKNYWNTNLGKKVQDHQNPASTGKQTKSNERTSKKNETQLAQNTAESHVVRTKAIRCSKVFINPPQPQKKAEHFGAEHDSREAPRPSKGDSSFNQRLPSNTSTDGSAPTFGSEEDTNYNNLSDFVFDFNMGELCLSDLLNSDFSELYDLSYSNDNSNDLSPSSEQPVVFTEEMLQDWTAAASDGIQPNVASNLHSFSPFLDYGGEWPGE